MSLENVGKGASLNGESKINFAGSDVSGDDAKYQAAVEKARYDLQGLDNVSDDDFKKAIDSNFEAFGGSKTGREMRGENAWTDLIGGANNLITGANEGIGNALDYAWDNLVGQIAEAIDPNTGELVRNMMTGKDLAFIPDVLTDIGLAMVPGVGIPLVVAKEALRNADNLGSLMKGKDAITLENLTGEQALGRAAQTAVNLGLAALPGKGGLKMLSKDFGKKTTQKALASAKKAKDEAKSAFDEALGNAEAAEAQGALSDAITAAKANAQAALDDATKEYAEALDAASFGSRFVGANKKMGEDLKKFGQALLPSNLGATISAQHGRNVASKQLAQFAREANKAIKQAKKSNAASTAQGNVASAAQGNTVPDPAAELYDAFVKANPGKTNIDLQALANQAGVDLTSLPRKKGFRDSVQAWRSIAPFTSARKALKQSDEWAKAPSKWFRPTVRDGEDPAKEIITKNGLKQKARQEALEERAQYRPIQVWRGVDPYSYAPGIRQAQKALNYPRAIAATLNPLEEQIAKNPARFVGSAGMANAIETLGTAGLMMGTSGLEHMTQRPEVNSSNFGSIDDMAAAFLNGGILPWIFHPGRQIAKRGIPTMTGRYLSKMPGAALHAKSYGHQQDEKENDEVVASKYDNALRNIYKKEK